MEKHRIFIVEDDVKIASLLAETLRKYQYEVETIKEFDHLVEEFTAFNPHMVLLDINLPSYDGYYWCRQLRQHTTCPIIFISARSGEMDQILRLKMGATTSLRSHLIMKLYWLKSAVTCVVHMVNMQQDKRSGQLNKGSLFFI